MDILELYEKFYDFDNDYHKKFRTYLKKLDIKDINNYNEIEESIMYDDDLSFYERYFFAIISSKFVSYFKKIIGTKYATYFNHIYMDGERRKTIVKYFQKYPLTINELADSFLVSTKTIDRDLKAIAKGVNVNGIEVKLVVVKKDGKIYLINDDLYHTTVHPISLNLNMTEIYTLLVDVASREKENRISGPLYNSIMKRIYGQLNDYGKAIIEEHSNIISYEDGETEFITEEELHKRYRFSVLMSALKSGAKVKVEFKHDSKTYFKTVSIKRAEGKLLLIDESRNQYLICEDDIIGIVEIIGFE